MIYKNYKSKQKKYNLNNVRKARSEPTINNNKSDKHRANSKRQSTSFEGLAYELPPVNLLYEENTKSSINKEIEKNNSEVANKLEKVLLEFGVEGKVINFQCGPVVTLFEFVPAPSIL